MLLYSEHLTDHVSVRTPELLYGHVGVLLLPDAEVPVGRVVVWRECRQETEREEGAAGRSVVPGEPAAHGVDQQHSYRHHRHGQPRQPPAVLGLTDLRHEDLNVGRVPGSCQTSEEPSSQHHPDVLGGGHQDPAQQVGNSEKHERDSPAVGLTEEGGDQTSEDGPETEHGCYPGALLLGDAEGLVGLGPVVAGPELGQEDGGEPDGQTAGESRDVGSQDGEELGGTLLTIIDYEELSEL